MGLSSMEKAHAQLPEYRRRDLRPGNHPERRRRARLPEDAGFARPGSRGVVVQIGAAAADMRQEIILVRFEGTDGVLGPPVGCLPEELTQDEAEAAAPA